MNISENAREPTNWIALAAILFAVTIVAVSISQLLRAHTARVEPIDVTGVLMRSYKRLCGIAHGAPNVNYYAREADFTADRLNDPGVLVHCFAAGRYSRLIMQIDGAAAETLRFYVGYGDRIVFDDGCLNFGDRPGREANDLRKGIVFFGGSEMEFTGHGRCKDVP